MGNYIDQKIRLIDSKATNNRPATAMPQIDNAISSKRVRRMWGLGLDSWNNIIVGFLAIGAAAALVVGMATYVSLQLQKQETKDANDALDLYKLKVAAQVAEAKKEGIDAGKAAGDALLRAAVLEKQAAQLKADNLALEAKIQPRRLTGEESRKISDILSAKTGVAIAIVSRMMDPEGKDFGDDLDSAFKNAKWPTARFENWLRSDKGVFIATVAGTAIPADVEGLLATALDSAKIEHAKMTIGADDMNRMSPAFQPNVLYLLIGSKP